MSVRRRNLRPRRSPVPAAKRQNRGGQEERREFQFLAATGKVVDAKTSFQRDHHGPAVNSNTCFAWLSIAVGGSPANVAGTFTYTSAAGTLLGAGNDQSESVTFTPSDSTDYSAVTTTVIVNVAQASSTTVQVTDASGTYNGTAFAATASLSPHDTGFPATLEGVSLIFTYYVGIGTGGTDLGSTAPGNAGTYTVVAYFPGSTDYTSASDSTSFTISPAPLTVTASNVSMTYAQTAPP